MTSSTSDWPTGIPYLSRTADGFSDGARYVSGTIGVGNGTISAGTDDRVFHLDIEKPIGGWSLGATNGIATTATATVTVGASGLGFLDLNGFNQSLAGIANATAANAIITNSSTTNVVLTLTGTSSYAGTIRDDGVNKIGVTVNGGNVTLSGTNTYSGNTKVNGGTLQILLPRLATNSTVSVAAGAVLRLVFTATNTVAGFIMNGVALAPGDYHSGNAAPYIAGSGSLKVAGTAPPPAPTIAPVTVSGTNLVVSVPTVSGYNYVLQSATNLTPTINWQNESTNAGTGGNLMFNVPITPAPPRKFLRFWVY